MDLACVSHLWMATQETKRFEMSNVEKFQVQPLGNMGSAMILGCWNLVSWTMGGRWDDRLERVHLTKERLLKDHVLGNQGLWGKCTTSAECKT